MKKVYQSPAMEQQLFETEDVITMSFKSGFLTITFNGYGDEGAVGVVSVADSDFNQNA